MRNLRVITNSINENKKKLISLLFVDYLDLFWHTGSLNEAGREPKPLPFQCRAGEGHDKPYLNHLLREKSAHIYIFSWDRPWICDLGFDGHDRPFPDLLMRECGPHAWAPGVSHIWGAQACHWARANFSVRPQNPKTKQRNPRVICSPHYSKNGLHLLLVRFQQPSCFVFARPSYW